MPKPGSSPNFERDPLWKEPELLLMVNHPRLFILQAKFNYWVWNSSDCNQNLRIWLDVVMIKDNKHTSLFSQMIFIEDPFDNCDIWAYLDDIFSTYDKCATYKVSFKYLDSTH